MTLCTSLVGGWPLLKAQLKLILASSRHSPAGVLQALWWVLAKTFGSEVTILSSEPVCVPPVFVKRRHMQHPGTAPPSRGGQSLPHGEIGGLGAGRGHGVPPGAGVLRLGAMILWVCNALFTCPAVGSLVLLAIITYQKHSRGHSSPLRGNQGLDQFADSNPRPESPLGPHPQVNQENSGLVSGRVTQLAILWFSDFGILPEKLQSEFGGLT